MVRRIRHIDRAVRSHRDSRGSIKLRRCARGVHHARQTGARQRRHHARRSDLPNLVVCLIRHIDRAIRSHRDSIGGIKTRRRARGVDVAAITSACEGRYHPSGRDLPNRSIGVVRHIHRAVDADRNSVGIAKPRYSAWTVHQALSVGRARQGRHHPRRGDFADSVIIGIRSIHRAIGCNGNSPRVIKPRRRTRAIRAAQATRRARERRDICVAFDLPGPEDAGQDDIVARAAHVAEGKGEGVAVIRGRDRPAFRDAGEPAGRRRRARVLQQCKLLPRPRGKAQRDGPQGDAGLGETPAAQADIGAHREGGAQVAQRGVCQGHVAHRGAEGIGRHESERVVRRGRVGERAGDPAGHGIEREPRR